VKKGACCRYTSLGRGLGRHSEKKKWNKGPAGAKGGKGLWSETAKQKEEKFCERARIQKVNLGETRSRLEARVGVGEKYGPMCSYRLWFLTCQKRNETLGLEIIKSERTFQKVGRSSGSLQLQRKAATVCVSSRGEGGVFGYQGKV